MEFIDFKLKYLKYKKKYFNLLNQIGSSRKGSSEKTSSTIQDIIPTSNQMYKNALKLFYNVMLSRHANRLSTNHVVVIDLTNIASGGQDDANIISEIERLKYKYREPGTVLFFVFNKVVGHRLPFEKSETRQGPLFLTAKSVTRQEHPYRHGKNPFDRNIPDIKAYTGHMKTSEKQIEDVNPPHEPFENPNDNVFYIAVNTEIDRDNNSKENDDKIVMFLAYASKLLFDIDVIIESNDHYWKSKHSKSLRSWEKEIDTPTPEDFLGDDENLVSSFNKSSHRCLRITEVATFDSLPRSGAVYLRSDEIVNTVFKEFQYKSDNQFHTLEPDIEEIIIDLKLKYLKSAAEQPAPISQSAQLDTNSITPNTGKSRVFLATDRIKQPAPISQSAQLDTNSITPNTGKSRVFLATDRIKQPAPISQSAQLDTNSITPNTGKSRLIISPNKPK
jgi:hypothetical protein